MSTTNLTPPQFKVGDSIDHHDPRNTPIGINATHTSIALLNQVPFVACCDSGEVKVKSYDAADNMWVDKSPGIIPGTTSNRCSHTCIISHRDKLFLAFLEDYKIRIFRSTGQTNSAFAGFWQDITPIESGLSDDSKILPDNVISLAVSVDRSINKDNLYLAFTLYKKGQGLIIIGAPPVKPRIRVVQIQNASTSPLIFTEYYHGLDGHHGNNISISTIDDVSYISFRDFFPNEIKHPTSAGRTNVMKLCLKPNDPKCSKKWEAYGNYSGLPGIASPDNNIFSQGPTYYNHVASVSEDHVYVAARSGLGHGFGSGEIFGRYSAMNGLTPINPDWGATAPGPVSISEIKTLTNPDDSTPTVGNFVTSAFGSGNDIYITYSTDYSANLIVFKFSDGEFKGRINCEPAGVNGSGGHNSYISMIVDIDAKSKIALSIHIAFVDYSGYVNVYKTELP